MSLGLWTSAPALDPESLATSVSLSRARGKPPSTSQLETTEERLSERIRVHNIQGSI